jgi:glutamate-ammonia-ligase adenylyltransferase
MDASFRAKLVAIMDGLPAELADAVMLWFERVDATHDLGELAETTIEPLARLVACSEFAAGVVLREWSWFVTEQQALHEKIDAAELERVVAEVRDSNDDIDVVKSTLRRYRHRYLLQVLWRETNNFATLDETLQALSILADRLLDAAAEFAERALHDRFGAVRNANGEPVSMVILGMGKLGGKELNFSSDIDLILLFPDATDSDGSKCLSAQEYFTRQARLIVVLLDEVTADGFAFRIDTRLRPFGDSGPPVVGFSALESYLLQHGRGWERYAYIKARIVGPQPPAAVVDELYGELISPFVYRRYLDYGVFESLREMQGLIAAEVKRRDMVDNVKLGPGGIREIEFIVQSLQLVRGGSQPELQKRGLLEVLPLLVGARGIGADDADELHDAYKFLRRLENFIQAMRDQQTHDLPASEIDRARLCLAMSYPDWKSLLEDLNKHRGNVTRHFEAITFRSERGDKDELKQKLAEMWASDAGADSWRQLLGDEGYSTAEEIAGQLVAFAGAAGTRQTGETARKRLQQFVPDLLWQLKDNARAAIALARVLGVVEKILRRSAYLALLNENPQVLGRLVGLCERSAYIAEQLARYPVLLDELLDPRVFSSAVTREEFATELQDALVSGQGEDSEAEIALLSEFQRASLFRIAVADFSGSLPIMKVSDSLTFLAEAVLEQALAIAWRDLTAKHGAPQYVLDGERHNAGFGIIAYGKLGGLEMSYGSDLDVVFLHDSRGTQQHTNGDKALNNMTFFTRLVRRLSLFLTTQTGSGQLYEVDTRLRPDGQKGVMVSSIDAFERYQEENAWTWEHQALLRARPVAGSEDIAQQFERIRADTLRSRVRREQLPEDVVSMRERMRSELDMSDEDRFDLKQGSGGIGDIEFIVQYLVLANAGEHPDVFHYSDNIRQLEALAEAACIAADTSIRLQDIYKAYRLRSHHLILNDEKPLVPQGEFTAEREVVRALWERTFSGKGL